MKTIVFASNVVTLFFLYKNPSHIWFLENYTMDAFKLILPFLMILMFSSTSSANNRNSPQTKEEKHVYDQIYQSIPDIPIRGRTGGLYTPEVLNEMEARVEKIQQLMRPLNANMTKNNERREEAIKALEKLESQRKTKNSPAVREKMDKRQKELNQLDAELKEIKRKRIPLANQILKNYQAQRQMKELQRSIKHAENNGQEVAISTNEVYNSRDAEFGKVLNADELKAARSLLESMVEKVKAGETPVATDTSIG